MRNQAEAAEAVACRHSAGDLVLADLEAATAVPVVPVALLVAVTSAAAALAAVGLAALAALATSAAAGLVGLVARTSTMAAQAAPADLVTSADLAVRVGLVAQVISAVPGVLVTSAEAATTSDRGPMTPSADSAANRGAMEPRLGAGALRPGQAGAASSLHPEGSGTRAR
jgi:hypothetical protein